MFENPTPIPETKVWLVLGGADDYTLPGPCVEYGKKVKANGGDIKVVSVDNKNVVNLELLGSCENCPISELTLKNGVEETIKKHAPEIKGINAINS